MQNYDVELILTQNNLLPKIDLAILNAIVRDMFSGEYYMPGETTAKCLLILGAAELAFLSSTADWEGREFTQDSMVNVIKGFTYFLLTVQKGYISSSAGLDKYREMTFEKNQNDQIEVKDEYLVLALGLLGNNPWGLDFANLIFQTESEMDHEIFFRIGLEVGYRSFIKYVETIQLLNIYEISHLDNGLSIQKLQKVLAALKTDNDPTTAKNQSIRSKPVLRPNSEKSEQELTRKFQEAINQIANAHLKSAGKTGSALEVESWNQLIDIPNLNRHYALFTFVHLSAGDFFEKKYIQTGQKTYLQKAKENYAIPISTYSFWANDVGTRYACDYKILHLMIEYFSELDLFPAEYQRLLQYHCLDAIKINERMYIKSTYDDSRAIIQGRADDLVGVLLEYSKFRVGKNIPNDLSNMEVLHIVDNNKSKLLNLEISLLEVNVPLGPAQLYEKEKDLLAKLRSIRTAQHTTFDSADYQSGLTELYEFPKIRLDLEEIWCELENYSIPTRNYVAFRRNGLSYLLENDIQPQIFEQLGSDTAVLSFFFVQGCIYSLFTVPDRNISIITSNDISDEDLWGYLHSYKNEIIQRNDRSGEHYWQQLGDVLFSKLKKPLSEVKRLCIIPHRELHQLPIHALTLSGKPIIDEWEIFYSPSLKVLQTAARRKNNYSKSLVMGYVPARSNSAFQTAIEDEIAAVSSILKAVSLQGEKANRQILRSYSAAEVIHIAGHGYFDENNPLYSGITLSDGIFSASHWLQMPTATDLVTLSACQTGLSSIKPGDELVGLARSVLFAGASSLLTTLWEVEGKSTRDWMVIFYSTLYNKNGQKSANKASAFRNATQIIKKEYKDPYYWAPFILIGNPV